MSVTTVTSASELTEALASGASSIVVQGELSGMLMITLGRGVSLAGGTLKSGPRGCASPATTA